MGGKFSSRTYNFNTLLGRSSFPDYTTKRVVIPRFQRGFSWQKSHVATFWEDVWEFHEHASKSDTYFLGPIVILPESDHIMVLDGQQRLATATVLFSCIRDLARQKGGQKGGDLARDIQRDLVMVDEEEEQFALKTSELDQAFFENHVQLDPPQADEKAALKSHRLIKQARSYLRSALEEHFGGLKPAEVVDGLKKLRTTLAECIKLVVIEVGSEEEAYQIFETLNDRGLRLSVPDLLLNFLMRVSKTCVQRDKVRKHWDTIVETMGTGKVSTFLRHMWVSLYGDVKSQGLYREIRKHVKDGGTTSVAFAKKCEEECLAYASIIDVDQARLKGAEPHVRALVKKLSADKAFPVLLSGIQCLDDRDFENLCRCTVSLVVRHAVIANLNPSVLEDTLYNVAREIREQKCSQKNSAKILARAKMLLKSINPNRSQLAQGLSDVHLTKRQAQYVLHCIGNQMQSSTKAVALDKTSIEHIFPENARSADWSDYDDLHPLVWHIGNLTLLEPKINRDIGNEAFSAKIKKYRTSEIAMTNDIVNDVSDWTAKKVKERATGLAKMIDQLWQIH